MQEYLFVEITIQTWQGYKNQLIATSHPFKVEGSPGKLGLLHPVNVFIGIENRRIVASNLFY